MNFFAFGNRQAEYREARVGGQRSKREKRRESSARNVIDSLQRKETGTESYSEHDAVTIDSPARPPLANIVIGRYKQRLPWPSDENFLEEDLKSKSQYYWNL